MKYSLHTEKGQEKKGIYFDELLAAGERLLARREYVYALNFQGEIVLDSRNGDFQAITEENNRPPAVNPEYLACIRNFDEEAHKAAVIADIGFYF